MALSVACFVVLTVRRLQSIWTTIKSTNYISDYADSLSRGTLGIFKTNYYEFMRTNLIFMRFMCLFIERLDLMRLDVITRGQATLAS